MSLSWTQAVCDDCWWEMNPHRMPIKVTQPETERCGYCGEQTAAGIYKRQDPATVPFPREKENE